MLTYATEEDLYNWLDEGVTMPDNAGSLLRSASLIVARAVNESLYNPATATDAPRRDATTAQVASWITTGIFPGTGGLSTEKVLRSKSVDGATLTYDTSLSASVTAFQKREQIAEELCPESEAILRQATILWEALPDWSGSPDPGLMVDETGRVGHTQSWPGLGLVDSPYWPGL